MWTFSALSVSARIGSPSTGSGPRPASANQLTAPAPSTAVVPDHRFQLFDFVCAFIMIAGLPPVERNRS